MKKNINTPANPTGRMEVWKNGWIYNIPPKESIRTFFHNSIIPVFIVSLLLFISSFAFISPLYSQEYDANKAPNEFRSKKNPYYWNNRKPFEGYWQQDVYYKIKANVDESTDIVEGSQQLTYWNNSPDTLNFVYFHLYNNAFLPNSYLSDLYKNNGIKNRYGNYQKEGLGIVVSNIKVNGSALRTELDNTILKAFLPFSLKPGDSITFTMDFKTYFDQGNIRNRMKKFNAGERKHYDLVHWFPRIAVYDRKFGWSTDQHGDHEYYGDFGTFEAEVTFANHYVVDGTGVIQNPDEVMPSDLRQKLDIKNFADKPWESAPSEIIKRDGTKKTWKFYAENVHDFALTADPTYRIGEVVWNGIRCIALVQEPHAAGWQNAAQYAAKVIEVNSKDIGMYAYPKIIVADARDGMEYPMLTLDGGFDPNYRDLLAHEITHNWFMGMVGNNETYRSALDEGFTQFYTAWTYRKIDGNIRVGQVPASAYVKRYSKPDIIMNTEGYYGYLNSAIRGDDVTLNTHSDGFNGGIRHGGGFGQVYSKTSTMLWNLQYVLGDELFQKAMQHYFNQWKFCHPYFEDFRNSIIHFTHVDLTWFFDQWLETSKVIDYGINCIHKGDEKDQYIITFSRNGRMQMPIDFSVIAKDSSAHKFHIPNTWFVKTTDATVLPRWIGWDKVKPQYAAVVTIPGGISDVLIDPSHRLADMNMLNNAYKAPISISFDSRVYNLPDWTKYEIFARPDIWYNGYDGVKVGLHFNGNYMNYKHIFDANVWFNTGLAQNYLPEGAAINRYDDVSFRLNYRNPTDKFIKNSTFSFSGKALDGLNSALVSLSKKDIKAKNTLYLSYKIMYRFSETDLHYLLLPEEWLADKINSSAMMGLIHTYNYTKGNGNIHLGLRSSAIANEYDYSSLAVTVVNKNDLGKININTRFFLQAGTGMNWPKESALYLAGANPEEMMDNKFTRSQGIVDPGWASYGAGMNYFHAGGGLNLRGYAGYLAPEEFKKSVRYTYKGTTGSSASMEIEFNELFNFNPKFLKNTFKLNTYFFGDAGIINLNTPDEELIFGNVRADAGIGTALTIRRWGPLQLIDPLTIRFDMPLFLSRIPATETEYVKFRWIIGINRAF